MAIRYTLPLCVGAILGSGKGIGDGLHAKEKKGGVGVEGNQWYSTFVCGNTGFWGVIHESKNTKKAFFGGHPLVVYFRMGHQGSGENKTTNGQSHTPRPARLPAAPRAPYRGTAWFPPEHRRARPSPQPAFPPLQRELLPSRQVAPPGGPIVLYIDTVAEARCCGKIRRPRIKYR